ncbi:hypothetical protein EMCG_04699 [[Emmonsia] crescens]|uniref:Protein kinase domain-containing protein n=1 Tax=[Emmonsia] crescens TaxID=73230 RepID=A0A0G2J760_9EURO|nr:hypothetical protein EMCG_04699 [Emmonsia crescens UAMH 3008]
MKAVVDAESLLNTNNVRHGDMHPRNILALNQTETLNSGQRIVVIVDFGKSSVGRILFNEEEERYLPRVEISPLLRRCFAGIRPGVFGMLLMNGLTGIGKFGLRIPMQGHGRQ